MNYEVVAENNGQRYSDKLEYPLIKLSRPVYLIKGGYKFLFLAERKERITKDYHGQIRGNLVSFLIKYCEITPDLDCTDGLYNNYSLIIDKQDNIAYLGNKHFDEISVDLIIKRKSLGIGTIILNNLIYFAKQEYPKAVIRGLFLSNTDEYSEENRLRRDKLYKNLGFDFKGTGGGKSTNDLKLSESKINLDSRGFIIKDVNEEELKKQLMTTELEMEKFFNIEVYYPEIKEIHKETEANLGHRYSKQVFCGIGIIVLVCMVYLWKDYLYNEPFFSNIIVFAFLLGSLFTAFWVFLGVIEVISKLGVRFIKKDYEILYKEMQEFLSITNLPIEKYLDKTDVIQTLDEYHKIDKEQVIDRSKMSYKHEDIFDLKYKLIQEKKLLRSMVNKFNESKILIEEVKEMYKEPSYILARALRIEDILKRYRALKETKIKK